MKSFNDYWDERIDANPIVCEHNPQLMNFAYSEALCLYEEFEKEIKIYKNTLSEIKTYAHGMNWKKVVKMVDNIGEFCG